MKVQVTWEMFDHKNEREFERCNEFEVNTIAQAAKWVRDQLPGRETPNLTVDRVSIDEVSQFHDAEGVPCNSRLIGCYEPAVGEWDWRE